MPKYSRLILAIICLSIIVVRIIYPKINFDSTSLILLAIAAAAIIIPDPESILRRMRKIKLGWFELELNELLKATENIEVSLKEEKPREPRISGVENNDDMSFQLSGDLHADILKLSVEIEKTLIEIYHLAFKSKQNRPIGVPELIETLREHKVINMDITKLLRQFWIFRNNIVHAVSYNLTKSEFMSFTDIGIRVLKILTTLRNNLVDGTVLVRTS